MLWSRSSSSMWTAWPATPASRRPTGMGATTSRTQLASRRVLHALYKLQRRRRSSGSAQRGTSVRDIADAGVFLSNAAQLHCSLNLAARIGPRPVHVLERVTNEPVNDILVTAVNTITGDAFTATTCANGFYSESDIFAWVPTLVRFGDFSYGGGAARLVRARVVRRDDVGNERIYRGPHHRDSDVALGVWLRRAGRADRGNRQGNRAAESSDLGEERRRSSSSPHPASCSHPRKSSPGTLQATPRARSGSVCKAGTYKVCVIPPLDPPRHRSLGAGTAPSVRPCAGQLRRDAGAPIAVAAGDEKTSIDIGLVGIGRRSLSATPTISGSAAVGATFTANPGAWTAGHGVHIQVALHRER